jgi:hypothetical protein
VGDQIPVLTGLGFAIPVLDWAATGNDSQTEKKGVKRRRNRGVECFPDRKRFYQNWGPTSVCWGFGKDPAEVERSEDERAPGLVEKR